MKINKSNCIKYFVQLLLVTVSSCILSPCDIKLPFALTLGLISASIFSILDIMYPNKNDSNIIR